jgi:hypothetical protein
MFSVNIEVGYRLWKEDRLAKLTSEFNDEPDKWSGGTPEAFSIPSVIDMLDHVYLEMRNNLLGHLDPEAHSRVAEVNYILVKKGNAGE